MTKDGTAKLSTTMYTNEKRVKKRKKRRAEQQYLQICTTEDSTNIYSHIHAEGQAET